MRNFFLFFATVIFVIFFSNAKARVVSIPLIGQKAPGFETQTTKGIIKFPKDYKGKWVIFFSFPSVFTPICTSEMIEFENLSTELNALNCDIIGISTNSMENYKMWLNSIKLNMNGREITFPLISDIRKKIVKRYGMIHPDFSNEKTVRSVFFIDPDSKVRAIFYYPVVTGRSFKEITRLLIAMQTADRDSVVTPPNWKEGEKTIDCSECRSYNCEDKK